MKSVNSSAKARRKTMVMQRCWYSVEMQLVPMRIGVETSDCIARTDFRNEPSFSTPALQPAAWFYHQMKRWQFRVASPVASERRASSSALLESQSAYLSRILARRYRFSKNHACFSAIIRLNNLYLCSLLLFSSAKLNVFKKLLSQKNILHDYNK